MYTSPEAPQEPPGERRPQCRGPPRPAAPAASAPRSAATQRQLAEVVPVQQNRTLRSFSKCADFLPTISTQMFDFLIVAFLILLWLKSLKF